MRRNATICVSGGARSLILVASLGHLGPACNGYRAGLRHLSKPGRRCAPSQSEASISRRMSAAGDRNLLGIGRCQQEPKCGYSAWRLPRDTRLTLVATAALLRSDRDEVGAPVGSGRLFEVMNPLTPTLTAESSNTSSPTRAPELLAAVQAPSRLESHVALHRFHRDIRTYAVTSCRRITRGFAAIWSQVRRCVTRSPPPTSGSASGVRPPAGGRAAGSPGPIGRAPWPGSRKRRGRPRLRDEGTRGTRSLGVAAQRRHCRPSPDPQPGFVLSTATVSANAASVASGS